MTKPIPDGYHTVTPYLTIKGAARAVEFYAKAFGAREGDRFTGPDGQTVMHTEIRIGDSYVMLSDEIPEMLPRSPETLGGTTASVFLYVPDVDAWFERAVGAGAQAVMPPADMFWGARFAKVRDPFGHHWALATQKEELSRPEVEKRAARFMRTVGRPGA